jgi:hypothetical protein
MMQAYVHMKSEHHPLEHTTAIGASAWQRTPNISLGVIATGRPPRLGTWLFAGGALIVAIARARTRARRRPVSVGATVMKGVLGAAFRTVPKLLLLRLARRVLNRKPPARSAVPTSRPEGAPIVERSASSSV